MASDRRDLTEGFLFTDQYQLTMAQVYWKQGLHERRALFDYFFRSYPDYGRHQAGYAVTAGLGWLLDRIETTAAVNNMGLLEWSIPTMSLSRPATPRAWSDKGRCRR